MSERGWVPTTELPQPGLANYVFCHSHHDSADASLHVLRRNVTSRRCRPLWLELSVENWSPVHSPRHIEVPTLSLSQATFSGDQVDACLPLLLLLLLLL